MDRPITAQDLAAVRDRSSLFGLLRNRLNWPVDEQDPFTYRLSVPGKPTLPAEVTRIVPFTANDPYAVYLVEAEGSLGRTHLREGLRQVRQELRQRGALKDHPLDSLVFISASRGYEDVRFAHFRQQDGRLPKVRSFGWEREHSGDTRTVRDLCLPRLQTPTNLMGEIDWRVAQWGKAWDVEGVTKRFYKELNSVFGGLQDAICGLPTGTDADVRRLLAQRLLNRLLFLQFLAKKGWLNNERQYLRQIWQTAYDRAHTRSQGTRTPESFYADYLWPLFFRALNAPEGKRAEWPEWAAFEDNLGRVPFLNGGLFAEQDEFDRRGAITIANEAFVPMLDLFDRFNFTITESSPDDEEVAVDPEMLGKVFEELVTAEERHDSGSHYTPRPIVAFMCREGLKGYLSRVEAPDAVAAFVDDDDPMPLKDRERVLEMLRTVKVCDLACGSGAYLLGMMQELLRLRQTLFQAHIRDHATIHDRKLEIIQRNLYGADKMEFAAHIAMLRLWLSLVVDDERDPLDGATDVSLPNLRFKIAIGDSLTVPIPDIQTGTLQTDEYTVEAARMRALHEEYFRPGTAQSRPKADVERDIAAVHACIGNLLGTDAQPDYVDWTATFPEVFAPSTPPADIGGALNLGGTLSEAPEPGGFDVVLANPPYIRQELLGKEYKEKLLKPVYPAVYSGTADIYCYFYARGLQMLRPGGMLVYISSNKWFRAAYGEKLRKHIADTCRVISITDFGELPVFETAATFPMIFVASRGKGDGTPVFTQVKSLEPPYPDVKALITEAGQPLPSTALAGSKWTLTSNVVADRLRRMEERGVPLAEYVGGHLYNGIKTGLNEAFVVDRETRDRIVAIDPASSSLVMPFVTGDDVRRHSVRATKSWLLYVRWDTDLPIDHPILQHLARYESGLRLRDGVRDRGPCPWWALSRPRPEASAAFRVPKIVFPEIAMSPRFALDRTGAALNNTAYLVGSDDLFLLGVLNSAPLWDYCKARLQPLGDADERGRLRFLRDHVQSLPVPAATDSQREDIRRLVGLCVEANGQGCRAQDQQIDARVEALYGL